MMEKKVPTFHLTRAVVCCILVLFSFAILFVWAAGLEAGNNFRSRSAPRNPDWRVGIFGGRLCVSHGVFVWPVQSLQSRNEIGDVFLSKKIDFLGFEVNCYSTKYVNPNDIRHGPVDGQVVMIPLWMIALASSVYPALTFARFARRRLHNRKGNCQVCCYDLTGNESGVCPECGTRT